MAPIVLVPGTAQGSVIMAAVVSVIQRRSAKDPTLLHLLRCLYFYAALFRFSYCPLHLPGISNVAADALSRDNMSLFLSLVPQGSGGLQPAAVATPRLGISSLDRAVHGYFMTSLSPGTLRSFRTALGSYLSFCHQFGFLSPFPSSESLPSQFSSYLAGRGLSVRVYLSGVRFAQISHGFPDLALSAFPRLEYVLRGIRKASPGPY